MLKKTIKWLLIVLILLAAAWAALLFIPKSNPADYRMKVEQGKGISAVSRKLDDDKIIYSRHVLLATAYLMGAHNQLHSGTYRLPANVSTWQILQRLRGGHPDTVTVRIIEGMRFAQMRNIIDNTADIRHDTRGWSNEKLLQAIAPDAPSSNPEGLFSPTATKSMPTAAICSSTASPTAPCSSACTPRGTSAKAACPIKTRMNC